jgi:ABC-type amino acid transport substrate-binding protein
VGVSPTRQPLQPEAIGAVMEVTKWLKPSISVLLELPLAVAVPKGKRGELLTRLNGGIASIRADGTWQRINEHWRRKTASK